MEVESITFNTEGAVLVVSFSDGTAKEYFDRTSYLSDFPDRAADCDAMGWPVEGDGHA